MFVLLLDKSSVDRCKALAESSALTQISLTLLSLESEVVAMLRVVALNLAASGYGKTLCGSLMSLNLSHGISP